MPEQKIELAKVELNPKLLNNLIRVILNTKEITVGEGVELLRVLKPQK